MSEFEILKHEGKPPFFRATPLRLRQLAAFLSIDAVKEKPELRKFVELLITTASTEPGCIIDSQLLAEQLAENGESYSKPVIEKRVRQLKAMGLLTKTSCKRVKKDDSGKLAPLGRACALYDVDAPPPLGPRTEKARYCSSRECVVVTPTTAKLREKRRTLRRLHRSCSSNKSKRPTSVDIGPVCLQAI